MTQINVLLQSSTSLIDLKQKVSIILNRKSQHKSFSNCYFLYSKIFAWNTVGSTFRLGILDGLHRCYAIINLLKSSTENWNRIVECKHQVTLKYFVLQERFVPVTPAQTTSLYILYIAYSLQLMNQRKKTVDHTLFDALSKCIERVKNDKDLEYASDIIVRKVKKKKKKNSNEFTCVHVLASTISDRRQALNQFLLPILKEMFKYLCQSDAYYDCVKKHYTTQTDVTKESFLSSIDFDKMKVQFQYKCTFISPRVHLLTPWAKL